MSEQNVPFTGGDVGAKKINVKLANSKVSGKPLEGRIAEQIGSGDNAKNSFIYITIKWSFIIGVSTTAALYIQSLRCSGGLDILDSVKGVWAIFMPVITLALGYAFGKGR